MPSDGCREQQPVGGTPSLAAVAQRQSGHAREGVDRRPDCADNFRECAHATHLHRSHGGAVERECGENQIGFCDGCHGKENLEIMPSGYIIDCTAKIPPHMCNYPALTIKIKLNMAVVYLWLIFNTGFQTFLYRSYLYGS